MQLRVKFEVTVPDGVSIDQAEEWLKFQLGANGGMESSNPLCSEDLSSSRVIVDQA